MYLNYYKKTFSFKNKDSIYLIFIFSFFLTFYTFLLIIGIKLDLIPNNYVSDELHYIENIFNLLKGSYQDPFTDRLVPPMHSLYLAPFVLLKLGRRAFIFANLIVSCLSICLTYSTSRFYLSKKTSFIIAILYGFYYLKYEMDFMAHTETLATFLIIFDFYLITKYKFSSKKIYLFLFGIILGALTLQRAAFIYVLVFFLIIFSINYIVRKKYLYLFLSFLLAFSITLPYQNYIFNKTGKFLFFVNYSAESLYWMSSPFPNEYGDWNNYELDSNCQFKSMFNNLEVKESECNNEFLKRNHSEFFEEIKGLNMIEKNDLLYSKAINNIKNYPMKYLRNVVSNISRLFYNIPSSYFYQNERTTLRIIPNSIIFTLILFSAGFSILNIKKIPLEMIYCVSFIFIYLALSSLVSAYARFFIVIVPYLFIWFAYSLKHWKKN